MFLSSADLLAGLPLQPGRCNRQVQIAIADRADGLIAIHSSARRVNGPASEWFRPSAYLSEHCWLARNTVQLILVGTPLPGDNLFLGTGLGPGLSLRNM